MGVRSILVALLGVAVASGSAFGAHEYLNGARAEAATDPTAGLVTVVVAGRDIPFGQVIQPQMLKTMSWPRAALPTEAVTDISTLLAAPGQPPRRAIREMAQGDLILSSKISDFGAKVTLVQSLGPNARAMAIKVDAETAVGGLVTPGDTVDIVLTQGKDDTLSASTILQNIRIVGVDQETDQANDQPDVARTVTVEVTPEQGQKLALAQKAGTLSLTLRTLDDVSDKALPQIRLSDLLTAEKPPEPTDAAAPQPVVTTIKVRRAGAVALEAIN